MTEHLSVVALDDRKEWDAIVDSFDDATIHYTNGYAVAASKATVGKIVLLYFEGYEMRAMNVTCIRKIKGTGYNDMTSISGFYGWITDRMNDRDVELLNAHMEAFAKENRIVSEFIRCNPQIESCIDERFGKRRRIGQSVIVKIDSMQDIWMNMHSGNRNCIKKTMKSGVDVHVTARDNYMDDFVRIYNDTMTRKGAYDYLLPDSYYKELFGIKNGVVLNVYAEYEGKIISSALFLGKNGRAYYHLSGSDEEYAHLGASRAVIYIAAYYFGEIGYDTIDLGGGVKSRDDSLLAFKKRFTKDDVTPFYVLEKVYDEEVYAYLSQGKVDNGDFFPVYRKESV